jgi:hypothetical protein
VRGLDDAAVERLRFAENIVAVESRTPSLEEIFVAYMTRAPQNVRPLAPSNAEKTGVGQAVPDER